MVEHIVKIECPDCGYVNHLGRYDEEECFKCGADLHAAVQEITRGKKA